MGPNTRAWYALAAGLLVVVVGAGVYFTGSQGDTTGQTTTNLPPISTSTNPVTPGSSAGTISVNGGVQSSDTGSTTSMKEPSLSRPYNPPANLPASVQAADRQAVAASIAQLKLDPNHLAYWLQLAIYEKGANDFAGAEEIWLYATERWPADPTAYGNLADLYANYLHDYGKAVTYYNKLITLQPSGELSIAEYLNLATLYNINLNDPADAKLTLQAGLRANPNSVDIQNALSTL